MDEEEDNLKLYKKDIYFLTFYFIYIDKNNEILEVRKDIYELNEKNIILNKELFKIIELNEKMNNKDYYVYDILKYNDKSSTESIIRNIELENKLETIQKDEDVDLTPNLEFFHSINSIFIIYKEISKLKTLKNKSHSFIKLSRKKK